MYVKGDLGGAPVGVCIRPKAGDLYYYAPEKLTKYLLESDSGMPGWSNLETFEAAKLLGSDIASRDPVCERVCVASSYRPGLSTLEWLHRVFGHVSHKRLSKIFGVPLPKEGLSCCDACARTAIKKRNLVNQGSFPKITKPGQRTDRDLVYLKVPTREGHKYLDIILIGIRCVFRELP